MPKAAVKCHQVHWLAYMQQTECVSLCMRLLVATLHSTIQIEFRRWACKVRDARPAVVQLVHRMPTHASAMRIRDRALSFSRVLDCGASTST